MAEYRFHWWPPGTHAQQSPSVSLDAQSRLHGAALALRRFVELGFDIDADGGHVDVTDADGVTHTVVVEEVRGWLEEPEQVAFVQGQQLASLLRKRHV